MAGGALLSMLGGEGRAGHRRTAEGRRTVALIALAGAALLLHVGLLRSLEGVVVGEATPAAPPAALAVRLLAPRLPAATAAPAAQAVPSLPVAVLPAALSPMPRPASERGPSPLSAAAVSPSATSLSSAANEQEAEAVAQTPREAVTEAPVPTDSEAVAVAPAAEATAPLASTSASERELPVYRTLIPPPVQLRYQLRRGPLQGTGDFQWSPQGERYEATLVGRLAGVVVLAQVSQGGFDEAGVAPLRFTDRRAAGALQAANFQREVGKITFSGPGLEYPLLIGSQDRLSWMVQLAAVVAAEPQRLQEGGKVVIHVVGARGDSRLWVFRFAGHETIRAVVGTIQAARFVREAAEAHDTRVDVWLDPLRHHLPARALLRSGADDEGLELLVQDAVAVP